MSIIYMLLSWIYDTITFFFSSNLSRPIFIHLPSYTIPPTIISIPLWALICKHQWYLHDVCQTCHIMSRHSPSPPTATAATIPTVATSTPASPSLASTAAIDVAGEPAIPSQPVGTADELKLVRPLLQPELKVKSSHPHHCITITSIIFIIFTMHTQRSISPCFIIISLFICMNRPHPYHIIVRRFFIMQVGAIYYILSRQWWLQWCSYVGMYHHVVSHCCAFLLAINQRR